MNKGASVVRSEWVLMVMVGLLPLVWVPVSQGQTTSITSSGLNTQVSHVAGQQNFDITGGTRPGNGTNLFHSFGDFSVGTDQVARFLNDSGLATENILSRVTGGHVSNILGEINTTSFPGANLYLINPAGVLFGPTATLNVSGSVHVSTADYLRLADGLRFNALPGPQDTLLSQGPVVAFGFLNPHPRPITVHGSQLTVAEGKGLSLVGGDIKVTRGTLTASGGQINLASLAGRGEARIAPEDIAIAGTTPRGQIMIKGGTEPENVARLDTSGAQGGAVILRGGKLSLARAEVTTQATEANQTGGAVVVEATKSAKMKDVILRTGTDPIFGSPSRAGGGPVLLSSPSVRASNLTIETSAGGRSVPVGDVTMNVRNLTASNLTIHRWGGNDTAGGNVSIRASGDVILHKSRIGPQLCSAFCAEARGQITIRAATLILNGTGISSTSSGLEGEGNDIAIEVGRLSMRGSEIHTSAVFAPAQSGTISVSAREAILIDGGGIRTWLGRPPQGGTGGSITLSTPRLTLNHLGRISTQTDAGRAGDISVNVGTLNMFNGGSISTQNEIHGSAGNIDIVASRSISMAGVGVGFRGRQVPSGITMAAEGEQLGHLHIVTPALHVDDRAVVRAYSTSPTGPVSGIVLDVGQLNISGGAGIYSANSGIPIVINAARSITLDHGTITTYAGPTGVSLFAGKSILIQNGSLITADNAGIGDEGHIAIHAGKSVVIRDSTISAKAERGNGGTIVVDAKNVALSGSQLTTSVSGGPDTIGGRIVVDAKNMTLRNSQILSTATEGDGGTIHIRSRAFHKDAKSVIDASSESGTDGTVTIESRY